MRQNNFLHNVGIIRPVAFSRFYTASGGKGGNPKTRFLFTGREWIVDMRVYDYRARMYQPELGRFLQPDPQEFAAGDYNLYRYCHNDPVNKSDPTGLEQVFGKIMRDRMFDSAAYFDSGIAFKDHGETSTSDCTLGLMGPEGAEEDRKKDFLLSIPKACSPPLKHTNQASKTPLEHRGTQRREMSLVQRCSKRGEGRSK